MNRKLICIAFIGGMIVGAYGFGLFGKYLGHIKKIETQYNIRIQKLQA